MDKLERKRLWRLGRDEIQRKSRELHNELAAANPHLNMGMARVDLPSAMATEQQLFMEEAISFARSLSVNASGNSRFQLVISELFGPPQSIDLHPLFSDRDAVESVHTLIREIHHRQQVEIKVADEFLAKRLEFVSVAGEDAIGKWESTLTSFPETGALPVILSGAFGKSEVKARIASTSRAFSSIVHESDSFDAVAWFDQRKCNYRNDGWLDESVVGSAKLASDEPHQLTTHLAARGNMVRKRVLMAKLRLDQPWHVPILLQFGGWNDAPDPMVQSAVLKSWHERYGAYIAGVGLDTLECAIEQPPRDLGTAMELAWEHYLFCPDIVHQGTGTIGALAETLIDSRYWYFWWD